MDQARLKTRQRLVRCCFVELFLPIQQAAEAARRKKAGALACRRPGNAFD
jgi:hypothetical protein